MFLFMYVIVLLGLDVAEPGWLSVNKELNEGKGSFVLLKLYF